MAYDSMAGNPGEGAGMPPEQEMAEGEGAAGQSEEATATIPTALLAGKQFKPGDEIVLEIVSVGDDGAVVKYATGKGGKEEEGESWEEGFRKEMSASNPGKGAY